METSLDLLPDQRFEPAPVTGVEMAAQSGQALSPDRKGRYTVARAGPNPAIAPGFAITRSSSSGDNSAQIAAPGALAPAAIDRLPAALQARPAPRSDPDLSDNWPLPTDHPSLAWQPGGPGLSRDRSLEAAHEPAAGGEPGLGADNVARPGDTGKISNEAQSSAGLFRHMNARARVLLWLDQSRRAEAGEPTIRVGHEADHPTPPGQHQAAQAPPTRPSRDPDRQEVARIPDAGPNPVEIPVAAAGPPSTSGLVRKRHRLAPLSMKLDFAGDRTELSSADQGRLEALSKRVETTERTVQLRAVADASTRDPSQARRLALKRLFVVRDFLIGQGFSKTEVTLEAMASIDRTNGGDRVEIAAGHSGDPVPTVAAAKRYPPSGPKSRTQSAAAASPALPAISGSNTRVRAESADQTAEESAGARTDRDPGTRNRPVRRGRAIYVQVGSHKRRRDALDEAGKIERRFRDLLKGRELRITAVDLEGRGRFHRVRTGPFPNKADASSLCQGLRQHGQDCLVVSSRDPTAVL